MVHALRDLRDAVGKRAREVVDEVPLRMELKVVEQVMPHPATQGRPQDHEQATARATEQKDSKAQRDEEGQ